jgi:hydroxyethylthiazole kinase-like uncharacterized protein yjeF
MNERWLADRLPVRDPRAHKYDFGRVLVVAGSLDYPGAAVLAGLGALRGGAGVVRVASAASVCARMAAAAPELTWAALEESSPGVVARAGWTTASSEAQAADAVVIGPGLGRSPETASGVVSLISDLRGRAVVDADGLNLLSDVPDWPMRAAGTLVLTPHGGEFARLTGETSPAAGDDEGRERAAADAAQRWGHVVVLKGARTVVAGPDGAIVVSPAATPALATAGSGDVLAGVIAAFLAAGLEPMEAAACGVGLHAAAGALAEERIGAAGTIASDIATLLPTAWRLIVADPE